MLSTAVKDKPTEWEDHLSSVHCFTGFTPFYLTFGREARLPLDLTFGISDFVAQSHNGHARMVQSSLAYAHETVQSKLGEVQSRQKTLYNQKVHG